MRKILGGLLTIAVAVTVITGTAMAATYSVTTNADSGTGSLRQAIASANTINNNEDVTITVDPKVDLIQLLTELPFSPATDNIKITVIGNGVAISGGKTTRIANVSRGTAVFNGVTFLNGEALSNDGGAVYVSGSSSAQFVNCTFFGNNANYGGAVCINSTSLDKITLFRFCSIAGNRAGINGGGVAVRGGVASFLANIVTGNVTANGDQDIYTEGAGTLNASGGGYNILGTISANTAFGEGQKNVTGVTAAEIFSASPLALENATANSISAQVLKLNSSSLARDYIPSSLNVLNDVKTDERGEKRPQLDGIDVGAYEASPVAVVSADIDGSNYVVVNQSGKYTVNVYPADATLDTKGYPPEGVEWVVGDTSVLSIDNQGCRTTTVTVLKNNASTTLSAVVHYLKSDGKGGTTGGSVNANMGSGSSGSGSDSSAGTEVYTGETANPEITFDITNINNMTVQLGSSISFTPDIVLHMVSASDQIRDVRLPYTLTVEQKDSFILGVDVRNNLKNTSKKTVYLQGKSAGTTTLSLKPKVYIGDNETQVKEDPYEITVTVSQKKKSSGGCTTGFASIAVLAALALAFRRK